MDNCYLLQKLKSFAECVEEFDNYISFKYKTLKFICFNNEDGPDFLLESEDMIKYPHIISLKQDTTIKGIHYSYICLFEKEAIVQHYLSVEEKIDISIEQFIKLFNLTEREKNKEIEREFIYHWTKEAETIITSNIPFNDQYKGGKIYRYKQMNSKSKQTILLSKKFPFSKEKYCITEENCICLDVKDFKGVVPPTMIEWSSQQLKELFFSLKRERFSSETFHFIDDLYVKDKLNVFLRINELDYFELGFEITFADNSRKKLRNKLSLNEVLDIKFIAINNCTIENSLHRNGQSPTKYNKVVVVGLGSLGSFIASELPRQGVKEIVLIDDDSLTNDNIARHYLGYEFLDSNKAQAMDVMLSVSYPYLKISAVKEKLTKNNISNILDKIDYDLIIVATGNEDVEMLINDYTLQKETFVPTMFCWLEGNAVGSHVFMMNTREYGCLGCLLKDNINYLASSKGVLKVNGCGGTYTEY